MRTCVCVCVRRGHYFFLFLLILFGLGAERGRSIVIATHTHKRVVRKIIRDLSVVVVMIVDPAFFPRGYTCGSEPATPDRSIHSHSVTFTVKTTYVHSREEKNLLTVIIGAFVENIYLLDARWRRLWFVIHTHHHHHVQNLTGHN